MLLNLSNYMKYYLHLTIWSGVLVSVSYLKLVTNCTLENRQPINKLSTCRCNCIYSYICICGCICIYSCICICIFWLRGICISVCCICLSIFELFPSPLVTAAFWPQLWSQHVPLYSSLPSHYPLAAMELQINCPPAYAECLMCCRLVYNPSKQLSL